MWKQFSDDLAAAVSAVSRRLVHVGGPGIAGRTGVLWGNFAVTLARQAQDGESVPVVLPGGQAVTATVRAWDSRTGLVLLAVPEVSAEPWKVASAAVGSLVLTVSFPSPQGPEARLDLVRFAGAESEWARGVTLQSFFQTDGLAFPGFTGAAVVNADGDLVGFVATNQGGNGGFVVGAVDLARMVESLAQTGSPRRAWLGVSTRPAGGQGLILVGIEAGSPAEEAGWAVGDLLVSLAEKGLREPADLVGVLAGLVAGQQVHARLLPNGEVLDSAVTPGGR